MTIEHPTARSLRLDNQNLTSKVASLTREKEEMWDELQLLRRSGKKPPKALREKIEELKYTITQLESDVDYHKEEIDKIRGNLESIRSEFLDAIRQIEIFAQGGKNSRYHEISPQDLLKTFREWVAELDQIISQ